MSLIVRFMARLAWPLCLVYGLYVVLHGHLTPGGGFQGGAVMATGAALMLVSRGWSREEAESHEHRMHWLETLGLAGFWLLALGGLLHGAAFFHNWPAGTGGLFGGAVAPGPNAGRLWTGGTIPLMNLAVGLEVLGGLSVILHGFGRTMGESERDAEGEKREAGDVE
jgi:multicomponent Na+:H+ antiporter subunit B